MTQRCSGANDDRAWKWIFVTSYYVLYVTSLQNSNAGVEAVDESNRTVDR